MKKRNIIIGIDGISFNLIDDLSSRGIMPNFKDLKKEHTFLPMKSSIPHISSVSWSSIITGKNPGEHGIYGFTDMIPNTYSLRFPNFNALKCNTFWQNNPEKKNIIFNVPSTYPARMLNGIHIAGFVALDLEKAIYPKEYIPILKELNYEIDVDSSLAQKQSKYIFLDDLFRVLEIRKKTYNLLWNKIKWDNFMFVITGSDRIAHFFWNAYEDNKNEFHQRFLDYFGEIDNIIGEISNKLTEEDTFIIISDHGMELNEKNVNLNTCLQNEGFLNLSDDFKRYNRIQKGSKAFSLDPGRIYLNKIGKYPNGTVPVNQEKETIEELKKLFYDLTCNNQKVIKKIYIKEEIYHGQTLDNAPDLVMIENKGFNLKGAIGKENIFEDENIFTGKHNDCAFLYINKEIDNRTPKVENFTSLLS